jgi:hypothetical protein
MAKKKLGFKKALTLIKNYLEKEKRIKLLIEIEKLQKQLEEYNEKI